MNRQTARQLMTAATIGSSNQRYAVAFMMEEEAEHVEMETEYYGNPNTLIVANITPAEYSETYIDVRTAKQYASRDHAMAAS